jgi:hypothetical protein
MELIKTKDLPKYAKVSEDMKKRAKHFIMIQHFGYPYFIPLTLDMKKALSISVRKEEIVGGFILNSRLETTLRDIIASVYMQIRDTVGAEVQGALSDQITNGLKEMFDKQLSTAIEGRLDQKLLPKPPS